ncbi:UbiD family decarboxylase [Magnetococcales bacterium HHB-1]
MGNLKRNFSDLRAFIRFLEKEKQLVRVDVPVRSQLEMTEICLRLLNKEGPAVLFTQVEGSDIPVLVNLFGSQARVGMAIGRTVEQLNELGELFSYLKQPEPPKALSEAGAFLGRMSRVRHLPMRVLRRAEFQAQVFENEDVDLTKLPIQTCWPKDVGPLVTWPLVITKEPQSGMVNIGVYRMQLLGKNRLIMRWLRHRGGAQHAARYVKKMPVAVAIGCDPATILAAVTPIPETLSEYAFAGLLREKRSEVVKGEVSGLPIPASAEIVLEGEVDLTDFADEGPFGDHTGYYNEVEKFPVFTVKRLSMRSKPIYLSTFTGRPPDEPSILALALNRVFVPLLRKQFPEIDDFYLPPEGCSYRVAVVSLRKQYPGHAFRLMVGIWGFLRQFLYTKYIIVVDAGVPVDDWNAVMLSVCDHVNAARDIQLLKSTPIDYLDFASPHPGLGSKMGLDATTKTEVERNVVPPRAPLMPSTQSHKWHVAIKRSIPYILSIHLVPGGGMAILRIDKGDEIERGHKVIRMLWRLVKPGGGADQIIVVDKEIDPSSWDDVIWVVSTRTDPARDTLIDPETGRFAIDATNKIPPETTRNWGEVLLMDETTIEKVDSRWDEYGFDV